MPFRLHALYSLLYWLLRVAVLSVRRAAPRPFLSFPSSRLRAHDGLQSVPQFYQLSSSRCLTENALQASRAHLENVLQALQSHGDDADIGAVKQIAQRLDAACSDQVLDLIMRPAARGIADGPSTLFSNVKFSCGKEVDQRRDDVVLNDGLHRTRATSGSEQVYRVSLLCPANLCRSSEANCTHISFATCMVVRLHLKPIRRPLCHIL